MTKSYRKILMLGASPLLLLVQALPSSAQSTATQAREDIEVVTVTAQRAGIAGIMKPVLVAKERSTISQEFINTQMAGQTVFDSLNFVPGFNFSNNDPYGNSGGNVRLHGFDGNRISFTWDGMPLNDTGNYALFTNQVADNEIINIATVNQGTTDVDSPTAAASGGVIAIRTTRPREELGFMGDLSFGSFNKIRGFGRVDSGAFGPWGTTGFASYSYTHYDKFKGPGYLQKRQWNAGLYQDLGNRGWISFGAHYNQNRNHFYGNVSFLPVNAATSFTAAGAVIAPVAVTANVARDLDGQYTGVGSPTNIAGFGLGFDNAPTCARPTPGPGTQLEGTSSGGTTAICTSYYNVRINPSNTGNIRIASLIKLADNLSLTVDPSLQYVLANGGGITIVNETDPRLQGTSGLAGKDLNGDGDTSDQIAVYSPNNTNTIRYGLNTSLLWAVDDKNTLQVAYSLDYGLHRQTAQWGFMDQATGNPFDKFAGYRDLGHRVTSADGTPVRGRDRRSRAILNQLALAYEGDWLEGDMLHVSAGIRAPFLERDLNQLCYVQATGGFGQLSPGVGFQYCTSRAPATAVAANGTVTFAGVAGATFTPPGEKTVKYNRVLPSIGFALTPWGPEHQFHADFSAGLSAPRTDNLYTGGNNEKCTGAAVGCVYSSFAIVNPETSSNYDIGYRYNTDLFNASFTAYNTQFKNRIVSTFDAEQGVSVDHNIGGVNIDGVDVEANVFPIPDFSIYSSASYTHTRVSAGPLAIINLNATATVNIAGKELVETPNWTFSQRYQYKLDNFTFGLGGKYVGRRFATDTNDTKAPVYFTANADVTMDMSRWGWNGSYLKFNASNLFDRKYFGNIATTRTCFTPVAPTTTGCTSAPLYSVGSPQTFEVTLRTEF